jgi:dCTP deaminase
MLGRRALVEALTQPSAGLGITPLIEASQIGPAGVDLRLGPDVVVNQRATGGMAFDPADTEALPRRIEEYQQHLHRPLGSPLYLQPNEFILARTLEWVTLPKHMAAEAIGRSSWGRLGLVIATATLVQPEWSGTITLELANLGSAPIVLYVGMRICQLVVHRLGDDPQPP